MIESFFIAADGSSRSVYSDKLAPFYDYIDNEKKRASTVEFDNEQKLWVATDLETGEVITTQKLREDAIKIEVEYLRQKFREGQDTNE